MKTKVKKLHAIAAGTNSIIKKEGIDINASFALAKNAKETGEVLKIYYDKRSAFLKSLGLVEKKAAPGRVVWELSEEKMKPIPEGASLEELAEIEKENSDLFDTQVKELDIYLETLDEEEVSINLLKIRLSSLKKVEPSPQTLMNLLDIILVEDEGDEKKSPKNKKKK
ncbi:MAG: hypothetical protein ACTSW1_08230 [Candidatus Hodarchaeales archaeon]